MSNYQANIIIKNPATPTGPNANGSAPGIWRMNEVAYWIKQGVWPNANILSDPYFPYVSTLLSTTSLGNANNNLFVDSSGAFNPISRNGNATQGSFTPYGTNWSNYFASSSDYLQISGPATGTGTWTVEGWFYFTSFPGGPIFAQGTADTTSCWFLYLTSSGGLNFYSNGDISSSSAGVVPLNTWVHIALVSNASTAKTYVNGTSVATGSYAGKVFTGGPFQLNRGYGGATSGNPCYQSNVRMVVGTAVYTANFTPPTSPLTAISGTTLLTCQSNRFRDASTNNYTVTRTGSVTVTEFAPFSPGNPGISYNQSDITNWSGYLDNSGDYLTTGSGSSAFAFGTGDFTIEGWFYANTAVANWKPMISVGAAASGQLIRINQGLQFTGNWGMLYPNDAGNADVFFDTGSPFPLNQWVHVALVRNGSTLTLYQNGVNVLQKTVGFNFTNTTGVAIGYGQYAGDGFFGGYVSNIRIVKGSAVYTSNFTPPTTNLTAISGTSLLTLQNAAFTDNSTNNFVITPNGNVTVTGNSPFNTVGYWSNYFDGSGDWLSVPDSASLQMGSSDFTYECWLYPTAIPNTYQSFIEKRGVGGYAGVLLAIKSSGKYSILVANSSSSWGIVDESSIDVTLNAWQHLAAVRSGSTFSVYLNGVRLINTTISFSVFDNTSVQGIGAGDSSGNQPFYGYLSNVRIVKGTAVYSGASFTPPTAPLTAISGTSLLTCQNGRFIDNSTNAFTVTRNGDVSAQSFDPFYTSTIASNGGSMYFDGSGDYLAVPNAANLQFGTSNFTVECWFNSNVATTDVHNTIIGKWGTNFNTTGDWAIRSRFSNGNQAAVTLRYSSGWYDMTTGINIIDGAWHHLAFVRENSTTLKFYIDGVVRATRTISASDIVGSTATLSIGGPAASASGEAAMTGYVSNARITNGSALYTATFTPTTSVLTPSGNTTLLVNGMNAGIYDATAISEFETFGNPQVSTVQSKFGGSSIYFDGSDDVLAAPPSPDLDFGTGDFTIEMWVRPSNFSGSSGRNGLIMRRRTDTVGTGAWAVYLNGSGNLLFQDVESGSVIFTSSGALTTNTWQHIAVTRSGSTVRGFINGVLDGSGTSTRSFTNTWYLILGMYDTSGGSWPSGSRNSFYTGWMDDVRITRGIARYTANFTPPTQAFPTY